MSALVSIEQTDHGWHVVINDAESAVVDTDGPKISVELEPDADETAPLAVSLG
jgi:hypothetical protein